jgi:hypothetical protein
MSVEAMIQEFRSEKITSIGNINDELCIMEYEIYKKN